MTEQTSNRLRLSLCDTCGACTCRNRHLCYADDPILNEIIDAFLEGTVRTVKIKKPGAYTYKKFNFSLCGDVHQVRTEVYVDSKEEKYATYSDRLAASFEEQSELRAKKWESTLKCQPWKACVKPKDHTCWYCQNHFEWKCQWKPNECDWKNQLVSMAEIQGDFNLVAAQGGKGRRRPFPRGNRKGLVTAKEMRAITPIRRNPPYPTNRNLQPGFSKVVRQVANFVTGAAVNFTAAGVFGQDAADYGVASRGWSSMRIIMVRIWGPDQMPAGTPEILVQVAAGAVHSSSIPNMFQLSAVGDPANTTFRPCVAWKYGKAVMENGVYAPGTSTIFVMEAASPTGSYTIDYHVVFN
jgi:hypothetical protein